MPTEGLYHLYAFNWNKSSNSIYIYTFAMTVGKKTCSTENLKIIELSFQIEKRKKKQINSVKYESWDYFFKLNASKLYFFPIIHLFEVSINFQLMHETQSPKHFLRTGMQGAFEAEAFVKSSFIHHKTCF